jgi:hypothetical protein
MAEPDAAAGTLGNERQQLFGQQHRGLVGGREIARTRLIGERPVDRLANRRMRMAEAGRTPGGGEIEQPPSVVAREIRPAAPDHRLRKEAQMRHGRDGSAFAGVETGHEALLSILEHPEVLDPLVFAALSDAEAIPLRLEMLYLKKVRTSSSCTTWQ